MNRLTLDTEGSSLTSVISVSIFVFAFMMTMSSLRPFPSYANNDQSPNYHIANGNTAGTDNGAWIRFEEVTSVAPFTVQTSGSNAYTLQSNTFPNNCNNGCTNPLLANWLQSIIGIDSGGLIGKNGGYWVHDLHIELFWAPQKSLGYCKIGASTYYNIDQQNYYTYDEIHNKVTCGRTSCLYQMTDVMVVAILGGGTLLSQSMQCDNPNNSNGNQVEVNNWQKTEGIIAGCGPCGNLATFNPLNTNSMFTGYIDMISVFNQMSNTHENSISNEGSNLYQTLTGTSGGPYNGFYIYTVDFAESTHND